MPSSSQYNKLAAEGSATESNPGQESLRLRVRRAARQAESDIIREALERHRWNRKRTAAALQISYRSLMYKMKLCNLRDPDLFTEGQQN
jgi:transcriptional regulator with PAS, ATPase and Fis domain